MEGDQRGPSGGFGYGGPENDFFDFALDEEYQIVMAYRSISGDSLFVQMWEPHQTSAFLCALLMRLYYMVTGTYTAVIIWLRVCTTLIQIALAYYVYRVLGRLFEKRIAFLAALIYFNVVPKNIQIPEFANMQLWFFTLIILLLIQYFSGWYSEKKWNVSLLLLAGVSMSLEVLSYPSCVILFPFFLVYIFRKSGAHRWRDCLLFAGTCGLCALVWLAVILRNISISDFVRNVGYILDFDLTHEISGATEGKLSTAGRNLLTGAALLLAITAVSAVISRMYCGVHKDRTYEKRERVLIGAVIAVTVSEIVQLFTWVVLQRGYEQTHIHFLVILLAAATVWRYAGDQKRILSAGIIGTLFLYAAVIYISDLELYYAIPHGLVGVLFGALVVVLALWEVFGAKAQSWIFWLLISLCVTCLVGKGFTLRGGRDYNTVLQTEWIMTKGPAAGILTDSWNAWIYNSNYADYNTHLREGDNVLIVTNLMLSENNIGYMYKDVNICHYSVVDPTAYDERLLTYWELYPEKQPDVIVVDCWYGDVKENPDSWIMQYIENDFGYTSVSDGQYIRFYRK